MTEQSKPSALKGPVFERTPPGDDRPRLVCGDCGFVNYVNPRVVVGAVSHCNGKVLLARRAIEPRKDYWTIPAGFLEVGETLEAGAVRETWEEARARIEIEHLIGIYNIVVIGQIYIVFRARMLSPEHAPGPESIETKLVAWDDVPWDSLAFPSVRWALSHDRENGGQAAPPLHGEPPSFHWER
ncbi:MAG: NUDIX hydrolase [Rhodobacteraceae bacterium]|nr:NUDIX hydrolase [Paracoccaceae bacterium]